MKIGATLFDFAMDRRFGVLRLRQYLSCAIAGACCLAAASARADEAHGAHGHEAAHAAAEAQARAEAAHASESHAAAGHADAVHPSEHEETAHNEAGHAETGHAEPVHDEGAHGEEAGEDEALGADPIALKLERLAGDPSSFAVKAEIQSPEEGDTLLTDVVLYWITPGGASVFVPI